MSRNAMTDGSAFAEALEEAGNPVDRPGREDFGNYLGLVALTHLRLAGVRPIILFGGATGLIGDPSGRASER